jgi:hypothetical protein
MMRHPPGYRPAFGPTKISRAFEPPPEANYDLRYDYFEIANGKSLENIPKVRLVTQIGGSQMPWDFGSLREMKDRPDDEMPKKEDHCWRWKKKGRQFSFPAVIRAKLPELKGEKPGADQLAEKMPELIVSLYNVVDGTKLGYIRQSVLDLYNVDQ